uniref:NADH-ubiquinone oxidoreductase chain 2 n=1 Tax=Pygmaeocidaris prionigera TaxID=2803191 RepID=A0A886RH79_9ECHN|nr:NADH dehydrogenase subunit 2 [Pygmaeocidaris prionigera]QQV69860.1 NADH dehydrogenase subunit 2 [Pygmaeocidaris prionigera]
MYRIVSLFLFATVILGTIIVITSENWFIIWVGLELSTLALVPILTSTFTPRNVEATVKYFLIQALSAALLLNSTLIQAWLTGSWSILTPMNDLSFILLVIALAFKLGIAPCHFWFPDVLQGLPFNQGLIVSTWQKIAPLIILFQVTQISASSLVVIIGLLSTLIGGWGGLNQTQTRKILAFSSIGNMGWIIVTSVYSYNAALAMLLIYLTINTCLFLTFQFSNILTLGHLNSATQASPINTLIIILSILSLGGLPPLTGFTMKFYSLYCLVNNGFYLPSAILITGSLLSLFFYLRIAFNASLILFPQHIINLTSWRNSNGLTPLPLQTWAISILFILGTISTPLVLSLSLFL